MNEWPPVVVVPIQPPVVVAPVPPVIVDPVFLPPVVVEPVQPPPVVVEPVQPPPVVVDPVQPPVVVDPVQPPVFVDPVQPPVVVEPVQPPPVVDPVQPPVVVDPVQPPAVVDPVQPPPVGGDPVIGDPVIGDPVIGDPVIGDPVVDDPVSVVPPGGPTDGPGDPGPGPVLVDADVTLNAPASTTETYFTVTVSMNPDKAGIYLPVAYLQVDLNHNGRFDDSPAESRFAEIHLQEGSGAFTVSGLIYDKYNLRAQVYDLQNHAVTSNVAPVDVVAPAQSGRPISFELNRGQTDETVKFLARTRDYVVYFTADEIVMVWVQYRETNGQSTSTEFVQRIKLAGSNPHVNVEGVNQLPGYANYFLGDDPTNWFTYVPTYAQVIYRNVYPGIDLRFYSGSGQLRYDFIVHAGADPSVIELQYDGNMPSVNEFGQLVTKLGTPGAAEPGMLPDMTDPTADSPATGGNTSSETKKPDELIQTAPMSFQVTSDGARQAVRSRFTAMGNTIRIAVDGFDPHRDLVIDPYVYTTFVGGTGNENTTMLGASHQTVDNSGNLYVTGSTASADFPTQGPITSPTNGAANGGGRDVFVTKTSADGSTLLFSTYLGGGANDDGAAVALDLEGNILVTGQTASTLGAIFPVTPNTLSPIGVSEAFVTKLTPNGSGLIFSTFFGALGGDAGIDIAADPFGNVIFTGWTDNGLAFPNTLPKLGPPGTGRDAFVASFLPTGPGPFGAGIIYSRKVGGEGTNNTEPRALALDGSGRPYVTGWTDANLFPVISGFQGNSFGRDAFVFRLETDGTASYSSYLGGGNFVSGGFIEEGNDIVVDGFNQAYVTGFTTSNDFPTTAGVFQQFRLPGQTDQDAFITKISATGDLILLSTYFGALGTNEIGRGIALDSDHNVYLVGSGSPSNTNVNPIQPPGSSPDAFFTIFGESLNELILSTQIGGTGIDTPTALTVDGRNNIYISGTTADAASFALQNPNSSFALGPLGGTDVFELKIAAVVSVVVTEDRYEFNDQSNVASNFGTFSGFTVFNDLNTFKHRNGLFDDDWFTFTTGASGTLTVNLGEIQTFAYGPTSQPTEGGDIHVRVYRRVGGSLVEIGRSTSVQANGQSTSVGVSAGEQIYVWVYGYYFTQGIYDLILRL